MLDLNPDGTAPAPVCALRAGAGYGKTRLWREYIAAPLLADPTQTAVLAVPRHKLADEVVNDLAQQGIAARVYRGREAADPAASGCKMCREYDRATEISAALGAVSQLACKSGADECEDYRLCGYQAQRQERPRIWVIPHQLLFRERPQFIAPPDTIGVDESFWNASLQGFGPYPKIVYLSGLAMIREIPTSPSRGRGIDYEATADLMETSRQVVEILRVEPVGRLRRAAFGGVVLEADMQRAERLEWRRKVEPDVRPGMPLPMVAEHCRRVADQNQAAKNNAQFWRLLARTVGKLCDRSPWLTLRHDDMSRLGVWMHWSDDIHPSWSAPTYIADATMSEPIVRRFFPQLDRIIEAGQPMPHTQVRQITDRSLSASMLIPGTRGGKGSQTTQPNNVERVRHLIEVRAREVWPSNVLIICQIDLESALTAAGGIPSNVELAHYGDVAGENRWSSVALLMAIGRPEARVRDVEQTTMALFGREVTEVPPDGRGAIRFPHVERYLRMRDGSAVPVKNPEHPDPLAEEIRWQITEASLTQAIGRGRGANRGSADRLAIDILTRICLPLDVDEVTTWDLVQPSLMQVMWARGAIPQSYADKAACYPDLFVSAGAAEQAMRREEGWQKTPYKSLLSKKRNFPIGICRGFSPQPGADAAPSTAEFPGFLLIGYRRSGSRGPAGRLLYDPERIPDPAAWLRERLGEVEMLKLDRG